MLVAEKEVPEELFSRNILKPYVFCMVCYFSVLSRFLVAMNRSKAKSRCNPRHVSNLFDINLSEVDSS